MNANTYLLECYEIKRVNICCLSICCCCFYQMGSTWWVLNPEDTTCMERCFTLTDGAQDEGVWRSVSLELGYRLRASRVEVTAGWTRVGAVKRVRGHGLRHSVYAAHNGPPDEEAGGERREQVNRTNSGFQSGAWRMPVPGTESKEVGRGQACRVGWWSISGQSRLQANQRRAQRTKNLDVERTLVFLAAQD